MSELPQVWLVTGASRGLGLEITKAALKAGHSVIACYRNRSKFPSATIDEVEELGGAWLQLDVSADDVESQHGRIDVLVNNTTWAILGGIEDTGMDLVDAIFKTNVYGTLRTIRAVLPSMRERKTGTIVNISSSSALHPTPGLVIYGATKSAVEGATESLQAEVASFNIRALLVEAGTIRTEFASPAGAGVRVPISGAYKSTALQHAADFIDSPQFGAIMSDPTVMAERIVEAVDGTGFMAGRKLGLRVPLGQDAGDGVEQKAALWTELAENAKDVWVSV